MILALPTLLINRTKDNLDNNITNHYRSHRLLQKAQELNQTYNTARLNLPDMQASGFMLLYQLRCGRESEAHVIAQTLLSKISMIYEQGGPVEYESNILYTKT